MDTDIQNLTMVNKEKADKEICVKCNAEYQPGAKECPNCGVIFNKAVKSPESGSQIDGRVVQASAPGTGNRNKTDKSEKSKKPYILLIFLCIILFGVYHVYYTYIESRIQAGDFKSQLNEFCALEISKPDLDHGARGEEPFRTGKVLVVSERQEVTLMNASNGQLHTMVLQQGIHPAWYKLNREIRAKDPADVDTLIRIHKIIGKAGRYGKLKTKVFNTHKIVLDVYDWKNRAFIGTKVFDPGQGSAFMTEEDYDSMAESVSAEAIAEYIQSMDVQG